ncbi:MAG: DinB family protein [Treponema sp.]|jgi:uncharacterized damage-inducible protein DinB|nr:DinB family protein [Treponema sp.]
MEEYNYNLLANYNRDVNCFMNSIIQGITSEEWDKQFPCFYKSIHEVCSHIYVSDFNWLKRFKSLKSFKSLNNNFFDKTYNFTEVLFSNNNEYITMRLELDNILINFIKEIETDDLNKILNYSNSKGIHFEKRMGGLLVHMFNHETHHRAMISIYLEMMGKENDYNSILPFIYKQKA